LQFEVARLRASFKSLEPAAFEHAAQTRERTQKKIALESVLAQLEVLESAKSQQWRREQMAEAKQQTVLEDAK
jgi:hypothetical protein